MFCCPWWKVGILFDMRIWKIPLYYDRCQYNRLCCVYIHWHLKTNNQDYMRTLTILKFSNFLLQSWLFWCLMYKLREEKTFWWEDIFISVSVIWKHWILAKLRWSHLVLKSSNFFTYDKGERLAIWTHYYSHQLEFVGIRTQKKKRCLSVHEWVPTTDCQSNSELRLAVSLLHYHEIHIPLHFPPLHL